MTYPAATPRGNVRRWACWSRCSARMSDLGCRTPESHSKMEPGCRDVGSESQNQLPNNGSCEKSSFNTLATTLDAFLIMETNSTAARPCVPSLMIASAFKGVPLITSPSYRLCRFVYIAMPSGSDHRGPYFKVIRWENMLNHFQICGTCIR